MATRFEVAIEGENEPAVRAVGEAALAEIHECEQRLSAFRAGSMIGYVNRHAHRGPVEVDADTFELLETCAAIHAASDGAFDVTVGAMMEQLGFRDGAAGSPAVVGMQHVHLDDQRRSVRFERPGLRLDLGAVGKGHSLDRAAALLRRHGVGRALLHGGTSTAITIGAPPDTAGFEIAIGDGEGAPVARLRDAALSVSSQQGRRTERDGHPIGHVVDPRRGALPADFTTAAVIASDATRADAWSTALLVLGPEARLPDDLTAAVFSPTRPAWRHRGTASPGDFEFSRAPFHEADPT